MITEPETENAFNSRFGFRKVDHKGMGEKEKENKNLKPPSKKPIIQNSKMQDKF